MKSNSANIQSTYLSQQSGLQTMEVIFYHTLCGTHHATELFMQRPFNEFMKFRSIKKTKK